MRQLAVLFALAAGVFAQDASWAGAWDTTYGRMLLKQDGATVTGTYGDSTLTGKAEGTKLVFRYAEPKAKGQGYFVMLAGGKSFKGQWLQDGTEKWADWTGTRAGGSMFTGVFKTTHGPLRFAATAGGVTAVYRYDDSPGELEGTVAGNRLTFTWAEGGGTGDGWFEVTPDGKSFKGAWRNKGADKWTDWAGERVAPRPGVTWLIVVESQWEKALSDQEYSFGRMLYAYFRRFPQVQVRHRRFGDAGDFQRAVASIAFLPEPTVVVVASHGKDGKLQAGNDMLSPETVGKAFRGASNVSLVHFSACSMMAGDEAQRFRTAAGLAVPVSGYAVTVDWCASAVLEMLYLDLVLGRGLPVAQAAALVRKELMFAGDAGVKDSPLGANKFRFVR